jgi:hypothetical protein
MSERLTAKSAKKVLEIYELKKSSDEAEKRSADKKILKFYSKLTDQILSAASSGANYLEINCKEEEMECLITYAEENGYEIDELFEDELVATIFWKSKIMDKVRLRKIEEQFLSDSFNFYLKNCPSALASELATKKMQSALSEIEKKIKEHASNGKNYLRLVYSIRDKSKNNFDYVIHSIGTIESLAALKLVMMYLGYSINFLEEFNKKKDTVLLREITIEW